MQSPFSLSSLPFPSIVFELTNNSYFLPRNRLKEVNIEDAVTVGLVESLARSIVAASSTILLH
jgi:hypothetical protein